MTEPHNKERASGLLHAFLAYGWWGLVPPLYFKALVHVAAPEILAHRIVWSIFLLLTWLALVGRFPELFKCLRNPKLLGLLMLTTILVGINWFTYIYSVASEQVVQASLGFFINPLVSVLLGVMFFHERLRGVQWLAVALAATGVAVMTAAAGQLPWIALTLAFSFGTYGMIRKTIPVDGVVSLTVEVMLLLPLSAGYVAFLMLSDQSSFGTLNWQTDALLLFGAVVTVLPLVWFGQAARKLPLSTMGFIQYLAPTLQLIAAVLLFKEPMTILTFFSFVLIWIGLAVYSVDSVLTYRQNRVRKEELVSSSCEG